MAQHDSKYDNPPPGPNMVKEIEAVQQAGELRIWRDDENHTLQLLTIPDLNGRPLCLPQYRSDIVAGKETPEDLRKRGVGDIYEAAVDEKTSQYLQKALTRLPVLLAVHATFNLNTSLDLDEFPEVFPTPIIGVEGPPWAGKTFLLITLALQNSDRNFGVRDFDPFGIESISNCLPELQALSRTNPGCFKDSIQQTVTAVLDVYHRKRQNREVPDTSQITLHGQLDRLLNEYKGGNPRLHYLIDLPGTDSKSAPPHIFQLLRFALSTINMADALKGDRTLERTIRPGAKFPFEEKYPYNNGVVSAMTYFTYLRQKILNPTDQHNEHTLLNRALAQNTTRHLTALRLVGANKTP